MSPEVSELLTALKHWVTLRLRELESCGYSDPSGHPHGYAASRVPEWELRQIRDKIQACIDAEQNKDKSCPS